MILPRTAPSWPRSTPPSTSCLGSPGEDPNDYNVLGATAYDGDEGQERARTNIQRFVQAHIVPLSPWRENERSRSLLDGDKEIWWEMKDGVMMVSFDLLVDLRRVLTYSYPVAT